MQIDTEKTHAPLRHTWQHCFGQGAAFELLRADCLEHVREAKRLLGFQYLRFHGLFHDSMSVVTRRKDGSLCFHWQWVDRAFDNLLQMGIRPFVELNPMPLALASGENTIFRWKMNVTPPRDYSEWEALIETFTRHCVERYGLAEVRHWYFEVWNEPNLSGFWSGSQEDYWKLYRHAATAVKVVNSELRVGGPATAQARWIPEFIAWCTSNEVPLDFVSTHSYQQDELTFYPKREGSPHAPSDYLLDQFKRVHDEVATSARPDLEIHWTEWNCLSASAEGNISWTNNPSTDGLYAGSFAIHHAVRSDELCNTQSWWIISDIFDEHGISPLPFSHTYGLFTSHGIPKPSLHAFRWLQRMKGERLGVNGAPTESSKNILVTREGASIRALLWFHPPVENAVGIWESEVEFDLQTRMLAATAHLGAGHGSAYESWCAWGSPPNLTPSQEEALRYAAQPKQNVESVAAGKHTIRFSLLPYEVLFIEFTPIEAPAINRAIPDVKAIGTLESSLAALTQ